MLLPAIIAPLCMAPATTAPAEKDVSPSDRRIQYAGRWDFTHPDRAVTVNSGSVIKIRWSGPSLALRFNISRYPVKNELPHLWLKTDDGEWEEREVAETMTIDGEGDGSHRLEMVFKGAREWDARWTPPLESDLDFRGVRLPRQARLLKPDPAPKRIVEFLGDSITEGVLVHPAAPGRETWPFRTDARLGYAFRTAEILGAQARPAGFGAMGILKGGSGGVPKAIDAFPYDYEGVPVSGPEPDVVTINLGSNDRDADEETFGMAYASYVAEIRSRYPHAWIVCMEPFVGAHGAAIRSVVERRNASGDDRVRFLDTMGWVKHPEETTDGIHPNEEGHRKAAERLAEALRPLLNEKPSRARGSARSAPRWIRPAAGASRPVWGIEGGIRFSLWPAAIEGEGDGGPRGLIRVGYPALKIGGATLVNFIAVEPETDAGKGYSELEASATDGEPGKALLALLPDGSPDPGSISHPDPKHPEVEALSVPVRVEKFANGAHPSLILSVRSDRPDELRLQIISEPDGAPMHRCILTATMGNYERVRRLTLKDETVDALKLYGDYRGDDFAEDRIFGVERLKRNRKGDLIVPFATNESDPAIPQPFPDSQAWRWRGDKVTQYWRKDAETIEPDLQLRVNARRVYWMSRQPLPGGIAFENVELQASFRPGQEFVFGITRKTPGELTR